MAIILKIDPNRPTHLQFVSKHCIMMNEAFANFRSESITRRMTFLQNQQMKNLKRQQTAADVNRGCAKKMILISTFIVILSIPCVSLSGLSTLLNLAKCVVDFFVAIKF